MNKTLESMIIEKTGHRVKERSRLENLNCCSFQWLIPQCKLVLTGTG